MTGVSVAAKSAVFQPRAWLYDIVSPGPSYFPEHHHRLLGRVVEALARNHLGAVAPACRVITSPTDAVC